MKKLILFVSIALLASCTQHEETTTTTTDTTTTVVDSGCVADSTISVDTLAK